MKDLIILLLYVAFGFFYWIQRDLTFAIAFLGLALSLTALLTQFRKFFVFTAVLGLTHLFLRLVHQFPYTRWPLDLIIVSVLGMLAVKFIFRRRISLNWSFKFSKIELASIAIINVPAILILYIYFQYNKELAASWPIPDVPVWSLPFLVVFIALLNGLREELLYRGLLQTLSKEALKPWAVVVFQAVFFGILHFQSAFPQGWVGVGLTAAWGALIAIQYHVFKSFSLVWVTHAVADAIMFTIILMSR